MAKSIEINYKSENGYEILYPNVIASSMNDFSMDNNIFSSEVQEQYGVNTPNEAFQSIWNNSLQYANSKWEEFSVIQYAAQDWQYVNIMDWDRDYVYTVKPEGSLINCSISINLQGSAKNSVQKYISSYHTIIRADYQEVNHSQKINVNNFSEGGPVSPQSIILFKIGEVEGDNTSIVSLLSIRLTTIKLVQVTFGSYREVTIDAYFQPLHMGIAGSTPGKYIVYKTKSLWL